MFIFFVVRALLASNMCSCNPLVTRGGAVLILMLLPQPSEHFMHFGSVRALWLRCGAHFEIARATLSALWAHQSALVAARC